jgi:siroheme synthase
MEYLTESNVNKYMLGVFAFAGALKAVGTPTTMRTQAQRLTFLQGWATRRWCLR